MVEGKRFTVGEIAQRSGVATSALRFYEDAGLIVSERNPSGHRRYHADVLRRVAFIRTAQKVGLPLEEFRTALDTLPAKRTPNASDWGRLATSWQSKLDEQIAMLTRLRDDLSGCIGGGCLSLTACRMWNPDDAAASLGTGARYLLDDERPELPLRSE